MDRHRAFVKADIVDATLLPFRRMADRFEMAVFAYCFMPDHAHWVLEGRSARAELPRFARFGKQLSGYAYSRVAGRRLWQDGYYDHIIRDEQALWPIVRYVLENPIRKGLVRDVREYPFVGSFEYSLDQLLDRAYSDCQSSQN